MMMAAPAIVAIDGTSPNTPPPNITAQTIIEYWYGTTTLAGASFSERLTHNSALTEMQPAAANRPRLPRLGVTQPNGDISAPSAKVPANCDDASTISGVARNERVISISTANDRLPPSAIIAGQLTVCDDGRRRITKPQETTRLALQRRQPTGSRSTIADSAVTKIGHAR